MAITGNRIGDELLPGRAESTTLNDVILGLAGDTQVPAPARVRLAASRSHRAFARASSFFGSPASIDDHLPPRSSRVSLNSGGAIAPYGQERTGQINRC